MVVDVRLGYVCLCRSFLCMVGSILSGVTLYLMLLVLVVDFFFLFLFFVFSLLFLLFIFYFLSPFSADRCFHLHDPTRAYPGKEVRIWSTARERPFEPMGLSRVKFPGVKSKKQKEKDNNNQTS